MYVFHLDTLLKCQSLLEVAETASSGMYQQPTSLCKSIAEILHLEKLTKGHFRLLTLSSCFTHKEGDEKAGSKAEFPLRQPSQTSVLGDGSPGRAVCPHCRGLLPGMAQPASHHRAFLP